MPFLSNLVITEIQSSSSVAITTEMQMLGFRRTRRGGRAEQLQPGMCVVIVVGGEALAEQQELELHIYVYIYIHVYYFNDNIRISICIGRFVLSNTFLKFEQMN